VLLAVALSLGSVRARLEQAVIQRWQSRVLVIDVTLAFLLGWPSKFVVLALLIWAFVWPVVSFDVLGEIARTLELLVALRAFVDLGFSVLLASGHRAESLVILKVGFGNWAFDSGSWGSHLFGRNDPSSCNRDDLAILVADKFSGLAVAGQTSVE
jgi:hypothetical protein